MKKGPVARRTDSSTAGVTLRKVELSKLAAMIEVKEDCGRWYGAR